jgi:hypothetical protein
MKYKLLIATISCISTVAIGQSVQTERSVQGSNSLRSVTTQGGGTRVMPPSGTINKPVPPPGAPTPQALYDQEQDKKEDWQEANGLDATLVNRHPPEPTTYKGVAEITVLDIKLEPKRLDKRQEVESELSPKYQAKCKGYAEEYCDKSFKD